MNDDVIDGLYSLLDKYVRASLIARACHWNVTGPSFFEIHRALGKQYTALDETIDRIAERIRALGMQFAELSIHYDVPLDAVIEHDLLILLEAHEQLVVEGKRLHAIASDAGDIATSSMLEQLSEDAEKFIWMLVSTIESAPSV